jgi:hypothetical protein
MTVSTNNSAALPIAAVGQLAQGWPDARARLSSIRGLSRALSLDRSRLTYLAALLTCGMVFGVFVGGFVGFMENATPHGDSPATLAQLATSDVQWVAMTRQTASAPARHQQPLAEDKPVTLHPSQTARTPATLGNLVHLTAGRGKED